MSLMRCEGFDGVASISEMAQFRGCINPGPGFMEIRPTEGRNGKGCLVNAGTSTTLRGMYILNSGANQANRTAAVGAGHIFGFALKIKRGSFNPATTAQNVALIQFYTSIDTPMASLALNLASSFFRLQWMRSSNATSLVTFPSAGPGSDRNYPEEDTWYHIQIQIGNISITTSTTANVYVNNILVASGVSIGANSGSVYSTVSRMGIGFAAHSSSASVALASGQEIFIDDLYWITESDLQPNTLLGDCVVDYLPAIEDGYHTDFVPSSAGDAFVMVDDSFPDGDTTYISSGDVGDKCSFRVQPPPGVPTAIYAVQPQVVLRRDGDTTRNIIPFVRTDGVDYEATADSINTISPLSTYAGLLTTLHFPNNPDTTLPWTYDELVAAEFGVKINS